MGAYSEDITGEIFGAEELGVKVELIADEFAYGLNPRDNDGNAILFTVDRDYTDYDERGNQSDGSPDLETVDKAEQAYDGYYAGFEWADNWEKTLARLEARGYVGTVVYRGRDGGLYPWSGWGYGVGVLYYTPKQLAEYWSDSPDRLKSARENLVSELDEYSKWATGDVWGVVITDERTGDDLDSCWGFIGREYAREVAKEMAAPLIDERRNAHELAPHPWAAFDVPQLIA